MPIGTTQYDLERETFIQDVARWIPTHKAQTALYWAQISFDLAKKASAMKLTTKDQRTDEMALFEVREAVGPKLIPVLHLDGRIGVKPVKTTDWNADTELQDEKEILIPVRDS